MNVAGAHMAEPRLMIVDDDPGTIRLLVEILKGIGKIHFTTNGAEAVAMARSLRPDLILLDVEMPDADGFCVCESIRGDASFEDVPILFVTSHGDVEIETRALSAGAIDFIPKPPHPPVVRARVRNYLALKQRTDELRRLSTVDGLTGVANRRAFDAALDLEWRRACRTGDPLSLLMIDVDFFKRFNDTYGHQAGDRCLSAVAGVLAATARRPGELAARYGGEEFVVLLPACDEANAVRLAEAMRMGVEHLMIPHSASEVAETVSISIGVANIVAVCRASGHRPTSAPCRSGRAACTLGPADLVKAADEALYRAKATGRNRVSASDGAFQPACVTA